MEKYSIVIGVASVTHTDRAQLLEKNVGRAVTRAILGPCASPGNIRNDKRNS